jgi:hypothetical protein
VKNSQPNGWQRSAQWRTISREAIRNWNAQRVTMPKCGARRKRDGEPCQNLAMANGRCRFHGGRTGKGDQWHRPRWPNGKRHDAEDKLKRKLADLERAEKKRRKRLAGMSPEERAAYEHWKKTHKPGPPSAREAARQRRQQDDALRASLAVPTTQPVNPEVARLDREIALLRAEADQMQREQQLGVFG